MIVRTVTITRCEKTSDRFRKWIVLQLIEDRQQFVSIQKRTLDVLAK